jgi:phosphoribosyl 1,2-cyclic phosphodiesterase
MKAVVVLVALLAGSGFAATRPVDSARTPLEFLGTGAAWTIPRLDCACVTCKAARTTSPRSRRTRASLKIGADPFLIVDIGPDVYQHLDRQPKARPLAILLTHTHQDHANGASDFDPIARTKSVPLYSSPEVHRELEALAPWTRRYFEFKDARDVQRVGPFTVEAFPLIHGTHTVGFRVTAGGRSLAYVCDVDEVPAASLKYLRNLDMMVIDGTNVGLEPKDAGGEVEHIKPDAVLKLIREVKPKRLVFTHIGHMAQPHEELVRRVKAIYGGEAAYDGWKTDL